jgi:acetyl esterase/lipase
VPCVVASLEYRLAPEHRLPAAGYEDADTALTWLRARRHPLRPWLAAHRDLSRCMGSSSDGNMAFFVGLRAARPPTPPCGGSCCTSHTSAAWSGRLRGQRHATAGGQRQALEPRTPHGCRPGPRVLQPHQSHGAGGPRRPRPTPVPRCLVTGNHDDLPIDRQREFAQWIQDQGGAEVVVRVDHRGGTPSSYS